METKKIAAIIAVTMMVLSGLVCLVNYQPETDAATLEDKGTVVLNLSESPGSVDNTANLKKMGLTPDSWQNGILVLDGITYKTSASCALYLYANDGEDKEITLEIHGTNTFVCGFDGTPASSTMDSACILAMTDANHNGVTLNICGATDSIPTDGYLYAESAITKASTKQVGSSYGIYSEKAISIVGCIVDARSGYVSQKTTGCGSFGIYSDKGINVLEGAILYGMSGDVEITGSDATSAGVAVCYDKKGNSSLTVKGNGSYRSYVFGWSGSVKASGTIVSSGVICDGTLVVSYAGLQGYGAEADNTSTEESQFNITQSLGLWCTGPMTISDSEVILKGDSVSGYDNDIVSAGIDMVVQDSSVTHSITSSTVLLVGKDVSSNSFSAGVQGSFGIVVRDFVKYGVVLNIIDSVFRAYSELDETDTTHCSTGIALINTRTTPTGTVNINDSEVSVRCIGGFYAIWAEDLAVASSDASPRKLAYLEGDPIAEKIITDPKDCKDCFLKEGVKGVVTIYANVVNIVPYDNEYSPVFSVRVTDGYYIFPACDYLPPRDDVHFKCWEMNGTEYHEDDVYEFNDGLEEITVHAVWVGEPTSNVNVVLVAVVAVFGLAAVGFAVVIGSASRP